MTAEYVKVDRVVLEEILQEVSELKKLAKEQLAFCANTAKRVKERRGLEELK